MAYVPNCKCDVFVSFAHLDDAAVGNSPPWASAFALDLKKVLRMRLGVREEEGLRVSFTGHSSPETGVKLESAFIEDASSAAIFVAVTSPAYVVEDSRTMNEFAAFQKATREVARIFAIEHSPLGNNDEYPAPLRDVKRISFWRRHPEREIPVTTPIGSEIYLQALFDLAEQIRKQLKRMGEEQKALTASIADLARSVFAPTPVPVRLPGEGRTIFLARASDDLDEERKQVRRYVEQYGFAVLPEDTYPPGGPEFTVAVERDLARADAFVQLLGGTHATRPPDMPLGYDRLQFERAQARGLPIMQWLSPDIEVAGIIDSEHARLLSGENVLRMGLEGFKAELVKRVGRPPPAPAPAGPEQFVFINADGSDIHLAEGLRRELRSADLAAAIPVLQGTSEDVRLDLEENIVECDALVMIYGETSPAWVRGQLRLYSKLKHRRKQPLKALALYVGPPEAKPDIGMDMPEIRKIDYREDTAVESLRQLLAGQHQ